MGYVIFGIFMSVFFLILFVLLFIVIIHSIRFRKRCTEPVTAQVAAYITELDSEGDPTLHYVDFIYESNGLQYTTRLKRLPFGMKKKYPVGSNITLYLDPDDAKNANYEPGEGIKPSEIFFGLFCLCSIAMFLYLLRLAFLELIN